MVGPPMREHLNLTCHSRNDSGQVVVFLDVFCNSPGNCHHHAGRRYNTAMGGKNQSDTGVNQPGAAFLVVREGRTWRDVFRLTPGKVTTVGRAPTNRIVVGDDICSRNHCEIFQSESKWTLRDLGSRNGTLINGTRVAGDWELQDGELIQIGDCDLGFTYDLSRPFPQLDEPAAGISSSGELVLDHSSLDT
ncbi:MAG: FHA domain-containing protein, partial [Planctomycetes bacterium]|nr:FHA domain-containing protein [Planctomycetota bacterium]